MKKYIELIDGGFPSKGEFRKNVIRVEDMKIEKGYETYRSLWNYSLNYLEYVSKTGSVTGYSGRHNSDILFFDFDVDKVAGTFNDVRLEVINLVEMLIHSYEVPADLIRITFSGNKGFHIIIPFQVVQADTEMTDDFCDKYKEFIRNITTQFQYVDTSIYNINRVIRVVNTKHGKSGLYKIPVTLSELDNKNFDIKKAAKNQRNADWKKIDFDEIVPNTDLNDIWRDIKVVKQSNNMDGTKTNTFIDAFNDKNPKGRHQALAKIAGNLIDKNVDFNNCLAIVETWNYTLTDPMTRERLEKDLRGLYRSFWNRRPESSQKVDSQSTSESNTKPVSEPPKFADAMNKVKEYIKPKLEDILVYGYKYDEEYQSSPFFLLPYQLC